MAKRKTTTKPRRLGTIWTIPDDLWELIRPILEGFWPRKATGRKVADWRQALNGIIFRLRTGCHWEHLPKRFGPKSTVHGWLQRWSEGNVLEKVFARLVTACEELDGVLWEWQSADGALGKARFGGTRSAPIPRIAANRAPNAA